MDIELARHVIRVVFRSEHELGDLLEVLKAHCGEEEYKTYAKAIASAVASINLEVMNRVIAAHPELEAEIEASIETYGALSVNGPPWNVFGPRHDYCHQDPKAA